MKRLEELFLRVADSDWSWIGFNWLRPAKETHAGIVYILFSSFILGLPGIVIGGVAIDRFCGNPGWEVWLGLFAVVMIVEMLAHLVFAHFWNRRAETLRREATAG
jgi:hypothetical protein